MGYTSFKNNVMGFSTPRGYYDMQELTIEEAGFDYSLLKTYSGYYYDDDKLFRSASGGAVSAISEAIIRQGGVVFGAAYSDDFKRVEYRCVDELEDLDSLRGSKYCVTSKEILIDNQTRSIFELLEEKIEEDRLVLFVGLGCDIGAVKTYCEAKQLNTDKLYTIDILCHGPTSALVHQRFVEDLENAHQSKLTFFSVKYKRYGWSSSYIHATFENGDIFEFPFYKSDYGLAFSYFSRLSCYNCKFRGAHHAADVTCGDHWGLAPSMSGYNGLGVSILFVRTPKGEELTEMIDGSDFHIETADTAFALQHNPMYYTCRTKYKKYDQFDKNLRERGLHYAVMHLPLKPRLRIERMVKDILPAPVLAALKEARSRFS